MGWLLVLGLKEGLVECATLCIKSEVILNCGHSSDFLQLLNIIQISNSILIRSTSNMMGNQGRNLFFRQETSEFLETVGGPYLMGPHHDEDFFSKFLSMWTFKGLFATFEHNPNFQFHIDPQQQQCDGESRPKFIFSAGVQ